MLLQGKVAVIYGAAGHVGGTVARTFAAEGARVFLAGRTGAWVEAVARGIAAAGGIAAAAEVDTLDADAVARHLREVMAAAAGRVDVCMNATGFPDHQGMPLLEMNLADARETVAAGLGSHLHTVVARLMVEQRSGVVLTLSTSAAGLSGRDRRAHRTGTFGVACAAIEELTRSLAGEVGPRGVRVVCLRPDALPETWPPHPADGDPTAPRRRSRSSATCAPAPCSTECRHCSRSPTQPHSQHRTGRERSPAAS
jgi:NAD(P)-dependent dehydrogenase (short-subunit alcohol dehydrogenase family)